MQEEQRTCPNCDREILEDELVDGCNDTGCEHCMLTCADCEEWYVEEEFNDVNDRSICDACYDNYRGCPNCGELTSSTSDYQVGTSIIEACYGCQDIIISDHSALRFEYWTLLNANIMIKQDQPTIRVRESIESGKILILTDYFKDNPSALTRFKRDLPSQITIQEQEMPIYNYKDIPQEAVDLALSREEITRCHYCSSPARKRAGEEPSTCFACSDMLSLITRIEQQIGTEEWPKYTTIGNYHSHHYDEFLRTADDVKSGEDMFFGIELETSFNHIHISGMTGEVRARHILRELKGSFVGERDGTVNNGAELISVPMSYKYLTSKTMLGRLNRATKMMKNLGATNGVSESIGLHVHVSRIPFEGKIKTRSEMEDDLNWFINCFQQYIEVISRRKATSYCRFQLEQMTQSPPSGFSRAFINKKNLVKGQHGNALNLSAARTSTYEFRMFNSTRDTMDIVAAVEFVRNLSLYTINEETIIGATFKDIIEYKPTIALQKQVQQAAKSYPELMKGWKTKRLKEEIEVKVQ